MEEVIITRSEIHEKIKELVKTISNPVVVKTSIETWLKTTGCSDFDMKQILNDLTSYKEYLEL